MELAQYFEKIFTMETICIICLNLRELQNQAMRLLLIGVCFLFGLNVFGGPGPGEIYVNLQKLQSLKRVLYVAAHPDDENTRALAWFSLGEKAETAYFSLTRGDGGQNLIGDELSEKLGVLRTQELLAARSHDGAKQFFSRAVDFGYSKSAEESLEKWGREGLLEDLVLMIRMFQPDVIVTRFPPDERAGHGHHTASAELAIEAFSKAADESYLPDMVKEFGTWQTTSIYWNTSYWWNEEIKDLAEGNPDYLIEDIGTYNEQLGMSYNEIGTIARSQHKCQGFGAVIERGSRTEYFQYLAGEKLSSSFFEKNQDTWKNWGGKDLDAAFKNLLANFDFVTPSNNVPALLKILGQLETLPDSFRKTEKVNRCKEIILDCLGLHADLLGEDYSFVTGSAVPLKLELLNRSNTSVRLKGIAFNTSEQEKFDDPLETNAQLTKEVMSKGVSEVTTPFWLKQSFGDVFVFDYRKMKGAPDNAPTIFATVSLEIDGSPFSFSVPATYKWRDPAYGERERPLIATPRFTVNFDSDLALLKVGEKQSVQLRIHAFEKDLHDVLHVIVPKGWDVSNNSFPIDIEQKHGEMIVDLEIFLVDATVREGQLVFTDHNGNRLDSYTEIAYDHIPTQVIFNEAEMRCIPMDAKILPGKVAYINGVKDAVPQAIETLGFDVDQFEVSDLATVDLSGYESVVLGIRVYNVHPELHNFDEKLYEYVENGGNLIMQYNTASRSGSNAFGPKPFDLSRNRVTEEDAVVTFLAPEHPVLNTPNKITEKDFENWVQERGLYFADNWDASYTPVLSWADRGEDPVNGGLIVLNHGKGRFIYTGISFFRELPKGVTGAYRLFANLLSYSNE